MKRLLATLCVFAACAIVLAPGPASAQVSAADAASYIDNWTLHMVGQMLGQFDAGVTISNEGGKLVAELVSGPLGTSIPDEGGHGTRDQDSIRRLLSRTDLTVSY
jgi:hypothetical protein